MANIAAEIYFEVVATDENLDEDIPENEKDIVGIAVPRKQKFPSAMEVCNSTILKHCKRFQFKHLNGRIKKKIV